jgi:hypothetical protein
VLLGRAWPARVAHLLTHNPGLHSFRSRLWGVWIALCLSALGLKLLLSPRALPALMGAVESTARLSYPRSMPDSAVLAWYFLVHHANLQFLQAWPQNFGLEVTVRSAPAPHVRALIAS